MSPDDSWELLQCSALHVFTFVVSPAREKATKQNANVKLLPDQADQQPNVSHSP